MALSGPQRRALFKNGTIDLEQSLTLDDYMQRLYDSFTQDEQAEIVMEIMSNFDTPQLEHVKAWLTEYD